MELQALIKILQMIAATHPADTRVYVVDGEEHWRFGVTLPDSMDGVPPVPMVCLDVTFADGDPNEPRPKPVA